MSLKKNMTVNEKKYSRFIGIISILIPLVVALLFGIKVDVKLPVFLPPIYASINAITVIVLMAALIAIKNKNQTLHKRLIQFAMLLSALFLVLYVVYHMTSDSTMYGGQGAVRYLYFFILISHILTSIIVIPFVLISYLRGMTHKIAAHKKITKIAFPLWLYVATTGVVVYLMISPYYNLA